MEASVSKAKSGSATTSLVLGIVGLVFSLITLFTFSTATAIFGGGAGIISVIMGIVALAEIKTKNLNGKGSAVAGIVMGIIVLAILLITFFVLAPAIADIFNQIQSGLGN